MSRRVFQEWRPVVGFEGLYEVSDMGNVRSLDVHLPPNSKGVRRQWRGRVLAQVGSDTDPRPVVNLSSGGKMTQARVHILVAQAFLPNPDNLPIVRHKDDDCTNNRARNLCWGTQADNMRDRSVRDRSGLKLNNAKVRSILRLCNLDKEQNGGVRSPFLYTNLGKQFGVHRSIIAGIDGRTLWKHVHV